MKYKTFSTTDEEAINAFLKENNDFINQAGTFCFSDRISFLFIDERVSEEEAKKAAILGKLKETLTQLETEAALQEVDLRHTHEEARHGGNPTAPLGAKAVQDSTLRKIEVTKKVIEQVISGEYAPN